MPTRDLTFAIVGSGGDGVITVGDMMAQTGASEGLHVMKVEAYGPQIRGGESSCTVRLSADPIFAQGDLVQVLVVFNWADFGQFRGEIIAAENAIVLYEATDETPREEIDLGPVEEVRWVPVPFIELAKESAGTTLAKNIVSSIACSKYQRHPAPKIRAGSMAAYRQNAVFNGMRIAESPVSINAGNTLPSGR